MRADARMVKLRELLALYDVPDQPSDAQARHASRVLFELAEYYWPGRSVSDFLEHMVGGHVNRPDLVSAVTHSWLLGKLR